LSEIAPAKTVGRRRAHRFGLQAEWVASLWLNAKGYRVLARRYIVKGGEIDLIVRRGSTIAFVEVKAREDIDAAACAIDRVKIRRISRAARVWLTRNAWAAGLTFRGDAVFIAPRRLPRHTVCAYTLSLD
jgi:putative endonuclease